MVQQDALLPWKTVLDNITLGLNFRGKGKLQAQELGREWIARVGLEGFADCYPHQLSGGMRKRVAMAQSCQQELLRKKDMGALPGIAG